MTLANFTELSAEINDWLDRDDLEDKIASFVRLFEARAFRELRIREMLRRQTATLAIGDRYAALPTGFRQMRQLRLFDGTGVHEVEEASSALVTETYSPTAGLPKLFTVDGEIEFDRPAGKAYTMEMKFYAPLTGLSDANPTNGLLTRAPDAYLWGSLAAASPWLENDSRIATWDAGWTGARDAMNAEDRARGGRLVSRVRGATP